MNKKELIMNYETHSNIITLEKEFHILLNLKKKPQSLKRHFTNYRQINKDQREESKCILSLFHRIIFLRLER